MGRATGAGLAAIALFSLGIVVAGAGTFAEAKPLGRTCATRVLARATPGREATKIVGAKRLARINHVNAGLLAHELRKDPSAWVDRCGRQFYVEPRSSRGAAAAPAGTATSAAPYASDQTFKLHSLPGSSHVIYLDFTGAVISGTAWNSSGPFTAAPYDTDGAVT